MLFSFNFYLFFYFLFCFLFFIKMSFNVIKDNLDLKDNNKSGIKYEDNKNNSNEKNRKNNLWNYDCNHFYHYSDKKQPKRPFVECIEIPSEYNPNNNIKNNNINNTNENNNNNDNNNNNENIIKKNNNNNYKTEEKISEEIPKNININISTNINNNKNNINNINDIKEEEDEKSKSDENNFNILEENKKEKTLKNNIQNENYSNIINSHQNPLEQIDISDNESVNLKNEEEEEEEEFEEEEENEKDEEEREWRETNLRIYLEKLKSYSLAVDKPKKLINENKENYTRPYYINSNLNKFKIDSCVINIFIPACYDTPFRLNLLQFIDKRNKDNPNNNKEYEVVYPMMPFFSNLNISGNNDGNNNFIYNDFSPFSSGNNDIK